jgi:hypothetical protein
MQKNIFTSPPIPLSILWRGGEGVRIKEHRSGDRWGVRELSFCFLIYKNIRKNES